MADLMLAAYEANKKHPLPLTVEEKKAHVFRLMLNGVHMDKSIDQLHKMFSHSFGRTTIADYKNAAKFARETAQLEGLSPEQVTDTLRGHLRATGAGVLDLKYDSKGYPHKEAIVAWRILLETGDISEIHERWERLAERHRSEQQEAYSAISEVTKGKDPEAVRKALYDYARNLTDDIDDKPDEDFFKYFPEE